MDCFAQKCIASLFILLVAGCASYSGSGLTPGMSTLDEVIHDMGQPAMQWSDADVGMQLAYPRGPNGVHTFMIYLDVDGRLVRIENVMKEATFELVRPGMKPAEVLRLLGPSEPGWTTYYQARNELVWEWRFCDAWSQRGRFDVKFDNTSGLVRSSKSRPEECGKKECKCSR